LAAVKGGVVAAVGNVSLISVVAAGVVPRAPPVCVSVHWVRGAGTGSAGMGLPEPEPPPPPPPEPPPPPPPPTPEPPPPVPDEFAVNGVEPPTTRLVPFRDPVNCSPLLGMNVILLPDLT